MKKFLLAFLLFSLCALIVTPSSFAIGGGGFGNFQINSIQGTSLYWSNFISNPNYPPLPPFSCADGGEVILRGTSPSQLDLGTLDSTNCTSSGFFGTFDFSTLPVGQYDLSIEYSSHGSWSGIFYCNGTFCSAPVINPITVTPSMAQVNTPINISASFTDPNTPFGTSYGQPSIHVTSTDWGDGTGSSGTVTETDGSNPGTVTDTHTYTSPGVHTIILYVSVTGGGQALASTTVTVNAPPTVNPITVSTNPVQVNTATTASANFTDSATGTHTATWNWGDGNTTGTVTEPNGSNPGSVSNTHTYTATGVYTVTLIVTNTSNSASGTSTYQYVAVYDSSTSFAGGSSFDNPSSASPNTTGKVKFGISAKYNNSNVLTGSAKMNFKAASLDFASTSFSSLATSNGKAYLKGSGTLNGNSGYTFLATGIDGSVVGGNDLIRFQIINSSNTVIYDSQPGAGDTADPTTVDATGNIRVH